MHLSFNKTHNSMDQKITKYFRSVKATANSASSNFIKNADTLVTTVPSENKTTTSENQDVSTRFYTRISK